MIRFDAIKLKMDILSIFLIGVMLCFTDSKIVVSTIVFFLAIFFGLFYRRCMPYFFVLTFLVYTNFCSLTSSISVGGYIFEFKLGIIIGGALILIQELYSCLRENKISFVFMLIMSVSVLVAYAKYGQPILVSIKTLLQNFMPILLIYPFASYLKENKNQMLFFEYCKDIICVACVLLCLQYFVLGTSISLLNLELKSRYSENSGYLIHLISPSICFSLLYIFMKKKKSMCDYFCAALMLITVIFVAQTRVFMLGSAIAIVFALYFYNKNMNIVSKMLIGILAVLIISIFATEMLSYIGNTFLSQVLAEGEDYIRVRALNWFIEQNIAPKILGLGIEYRGYSGSPYLKGVENYGYYISDLGIAGFVLQYGIQGLIAFVSMIYCYAKKGWSCNNSFNHGLLAGLIVIMISTAITVSPSSYLIPIIMIFSLFESNRFVREDSPELTSVLEN